MGFKHKIKIEETIFTDGDSVYWEDYYTNEDGQEGYVLYKLEFREVVWFATLYDEDGCCLHEEELEYLDYKKMKLWNKSSSSHRKQNDG